jgi:hypothetical protein
VVVEDGGDRGLGGIVRVGGVVGVVGVGVHGGWFSEMRLGPGCGVGAEPVARQTSAYKNENGRPK